MMPLYIELIENFVSFACNTDVLAANRGRVVAAITIHSFSQLWMSPYGYQNALPTDYAEMVSYYLMYHLHYGAIIIFHFFLQLQFRVMEISVNGKFPLIILS